ncbi:PAAR domain-containing protein [[Pseudomonas] boreopolis]|uniref:T6SS Phospholipase effector Tle1-like catalytic domain-containing protein n=1 Tax=Xanthomonas boreopolis TaxID=86183 RepID=A0A919FBP0_9XANT|nr:hypothetical protein GCM10009090_33450 [[Pseudomonas] boreopolis]
MRPIIVVGDRLSHGGSVVSGTSSSDIHGKLIARVGDRVVCAVHGTNSIATGDSTLMFDGQAVARHGDKTACGAMLISSQQVTTVDDGSAAAARKASAAGTLAALAPAATPATAEPAALQAETAPPAQETPTTVKLRIGVFFDGTNNNAANVAQGLQCRASSAEALGQSAEDRQSIAESCRPFMLKEGSSYDNGITNVARLFRLYEDSTATSFEPGTSDYSLRIYVEGIGTSAGEPDDLLSQGLGGGRTGVLAKVEQTFRQLVPEQLRTFVANASGAQVEAIEFDVFGFSRGAAAARHFVNQINRKGLGPLGDALLQSGVTYAPTFKLTNAVQVGFVGLFDTVAAIGSLADGLNVRDGNDGGVQTQLPAGCARKVVQLTARDEYRANFLLTTVAPPHQEIALPGVHSDVGGGYHRDREGPLMLEKPVGYIESGTGLSPGQTPDRTQLERSRAYAQAEAACARWREHLGLDAQAIRVDAWHHWQSQRRAGSASMQPDWMLRIYAVPVLERPLDWRYQLIPLRLMHKLAMEAGVPWKQSPDDIPEYSVPADLESVAAKLFATQPLSVEEESLLRSKYLHQSSHWNFAMGRNPVSLDLVYVNRPDPSGRRGIKPNQ